MYILSQVLVAVSDVLCILSMLSKKKKQVVFYLILSTVLFTTHYICLDGWTGAAMGLIELVFLIVMYLLEAKGKQQYSPHLSTATIVVSVVLSVITWDGWISLLPMLAMVIYLLGMMFTNVVFVKAGAFIRLVLNGVYMLMLKSYFGAGLSVVILVFTIIGIVNDYRAKRVEQTTASEQVVQDTSRDE